jgi:hypothetical protein
LDVLAPSLTTLSMVNSSKPVTEARRAYNPPSVPNLFDVNHDERLFGGEACSVADLLLSPLIEITGTEADVSDRTIPSPLEGDDDGEK